MTLRAHASQGSVLLQTRCGAIEYQEDGVGVPLAVFGGESGHDQGMAFAGALARQGIRVIAMSRFGCLRTPMPMGGGPSLMYAAHAIVAFEEFSRLLPT